MQNPDLADAGKADSAAGGLISLTQQQVRFFQCFGFLRIPGVFSGDELERIEAGFEEMFVGHDDPARDDVMYIKESPLHTDARLHEDPHRYIIANFLERSESLGWLRDDPRIQAIPRALIGKEYEPASSEGSLFYCETSWHPDFYQATMEQFHIKISLYLESLRGDSGAIRVLPGSQFHDETYNQRLRWMMFSDTDKIRDHFGVEADELPSHTVDTNAGDLVVWDYRVIHASFRGGPRRRLLSINFREPESKGE